MANVAIQIYRTKRNRVFGKILNKTKQVFFRRPACGIEGAIAAYWPAKLGSF